MSKIVLVANSTDDLSFLSKVRKITGISVGDLRAKLSSQQPFYEALLFGNDHQEQADILKKIADEANILGIYLNVYEIEPQENFATCIKKECEINIEIMNNILNEWERRNL